MSDDITRFSLSLPSDLVHELDTTAASEAANNPGHRVSRTGLIEKYIREGLARVDKKHRSSTKATGR